MLFQLIVWYYPKGLWSLPARRNWRYFHLKDLNIILGRRLQFFNSQSSTCHAALKTQINVDIEVLCKILWLDTCIFVNILLKFSIVIPWNKSDPGSLSTSLQFSRAQSLPYLFKCGAPTALFDQFFKFHLASFYTTDSLYLRSRWNANWKCHMSTTMTS